MELWLWLWLWKVKLMSVSAELIVFVLIQVLMMSVWAQVHGQVLMCMPVCVIGTDDSGGKFMKISGFGRSAA